MTKHIVINTGYGGFSLSEEGTEHYAQLAGITLYSQPSPYLRREKNYYTSPDFSPGTFFSNRDIRRDDPHLVQTVRDLGEQANGPIASLKIVEIPDSIDWTIQDYDGREWIAERHETWS